jgi:hypothetical protein
MDYLILAFYANHIPQSSFIRFQTEHQYIIMKYAINDNQFDILNGYNHVNGSEVQENQ